MSRSSFRRARWIRLACLAVAVPLLVPATGAIAATPAQDPVAAPPHDDLLWTTAGDETGLHVLVANAKDGYAWRTAATLSEPGFDADQWIGHGCLTGSGRRAVVVYAPRTFTNEADHYDRGGFTAVVDLGTGVVTKTAVRASLAYFNPGCGAGETVVLTQLGGETIPATRLITLDAVTAGTAEPLELPGELTSAVPVAGGIVAADGPRLVRVTGTGERTQIAPSAGVPFDVHPDADGGVSFLERAGDEVRATWADGKRVRSFATGKVAGLGLAAGTGGRVFLTGSPESVEPLPAKVGRLSVPAAAEPSSTGYAVVEAVTPVDHSTVRMQVGVPKANRTTTITVDPEAVTAVAESSGHAPSPGLSTGGQAAAAAGGEDPHNPAETAYSCAVPRNDANSQVYQPTARQVEWAADMAVNGALTLTRPANWKRNGLPAYSPQALFPRVPLKLSTGGGGTDRTSSSADPHVPPQILLGIMAQESNLWQASRAVPEGSAGNPLIGNYYGMATSALGDESKWTIDFAKADCGYGVGQITDGMRRHGYEKPGETASLTELQQRAVALDYTANVAAAARIIEDKWNQVREAGMVLGNGDPAGLENWFYAIWAYNSGFHPYTSPGAPWGLGWLNNPANPRYPADRAPFLLSPADAAHPERWPYEEKVIGFAGYSIAKPYGAGFKPAWWNTEGYKLQMKPVNTQFCNAGNQCQPGGLFPPNDPGVIGEPAGPCAHKNAAGQYDLQCWVHTSNPWKENCAASCGVGWERFDPGQYPEQPDGTDSAPECSVPVWFSGAWIIDDMDDSFRSIRPGCPKEWTSSGNFRLDFGADAAGRYLSKIDTAQVQAGFGGHFWFNHTRKRSEDREGALRVTGTWTLKEAYQGWAQVLVHLPDIGAHTQQAAYTVDLGDGRRKTRTLPQRTEANKWVELGSFQFNGVPSVSLSNNTRDGGTDEDIAWDAIAIKPLGQHKPRDFIVSLGDSFASGEGSGGDAGELFYRETDNNGANNHRNACHRSKVAWALQGRLSGRAGHTIGSFVDQFDSDLDFHFLACSGARSRNLLPSPEGSGSYRELSQIDSGFLDENTTLVTLSAGGNDAEFIRVLTECFKIGGDCQNSTISGDTQPLSVTQPARISAAGDSVANVLVNIHRAAPNAKILLMGYPDLFVPGASCIDTLITPNEANWVNEMSHRMFLALEDAVETVQRERDVPVTYLSPTGFVGHEICGTDEAFNKIVLKKTDGDAPSQLISSQSFHPNQAGASHFADTYSEQLRKMGI